MATGPLEKVWAVKRQPAPFLPWTHTMSGPLSYELYRAVIKVDWYQPQNHIVGKAFMAVESYDDTLASVGEGFVYGCPGLRV